MAKTKSGKRNNGYYLKRLRNEHPAIYADLQAGKFRSNAEAFRTAGLRKTTSPYDDLTAAWRKASPTERDAFKAQIGCVAIPPATPASSSPSTSTSGRMQPGSSRLPPALAADIHSIMARRKLKVGEVMVEIGEKSLNASLGMAFNRGTLLKNTLLEKLEAWVKADKA